MASVKEVAKTAGVSVATVSHVINGTRFVSPELAGRVRDAMAKLDYVPNLVARSLRTQRTHSLGFITADLANPYYPAVAKGASVAAAQRGYHVILVDCDDSPVVEEQATTVLLQKRVDGLMYTSITTDSAIPGRLRDRGTPCVLITRRTDRRDSLHVGIDNEGGMIEAVNHLARLGHRRIAFVRGNPSSSAAAARIKGFEEGLRRNHLVCEPTLICDGDYREASGYRAAQYLLELDVPPTALICSNDVMAFGAWQCLAQMGLHVPNDVSLVGFDDISLSSMGPVGLTTVRSPTYEMGATAANMLIDVIEGKALEHKTIQLAVELVVRDTTGPVSDASQGRE